MSSGANFSDFIQAGDATCLQVFMTNERHPRHAHNLERNNRALFDACRVGAEEICEVLISFGANVISVVDQVTPLYIACFNAHPACVDILLPHGVDVNSYIFDNDQTPLMATATEHHNPVDQFIDNRCRCMRSLMDAGAAIDQRNNNGWTALMFATWNFSLTEILVKEGADVNILNNNRTSALHFASERNNSDVVTLLLECGLDIDAVNVHGETPLHRACYYLNAAVIDTLLRHCADIDIVDNRSRTAFQLAMSRPASPNRVAVLQLMAMCAQTRLEESSADWIRLARNERSRPQITQGSMGTARQRRRRLI